MRPPPRCPACLASRTTCPISMGLQSLPSACRMRGFPRTAKIRCHKGCMMEHLQQGLQYRPIRIRYNMARFGFSFTFCSGARAIVESSLCWQCGVPPWYSMDMGLPIIGVPVKGCSLEGPIHCIDHVPLLMSLAAWRSSVAVTWRIQHRRKTAEGRLHFANISTSMSIPLNGLFMAVLNSPSQVIAIVEGSKGVNWGVGQGYCHTGIVGSVTL